MITRLYKAGVWLAFAGIGVAALLAMGQTAQVDLPPRPTRTPSVTPTATSVAAPAVRPAPAGAWIELRTQFPSTWPWDKVHWRDLWTVVQLSICPTEGLTASWLESTINASGYAKRGMYDG